MKYNPEVRSIEELAVKLKAEIARLFPPDMEILAEPGRFLVANACTLIAKVVGKGIPGRQALLLHQRWRVPHLLGAGLRPLHLPGARVQGGAALYLSGLRADLRCVRYDHALGRAPRARDRRSCLFGKYRGLLDCLVHVLQRFSPGKSRAYQQVIFFLVILALGRGPTGGRESTA